MSTTITFNDGTAATLTNGQAAPGDRFGNWVPQTTPIGAVATLQATGAIAQFRTRMQYGASFEVRRIPVATTGGVRPVDIAVRLIAHLLGGGTCAVNTGDAESNSYATCGLMPGTTPTLALSDRKQLWYTLTLSLINLAGSPGPMVCHYVA